MRVMSTNSVAKTAEKFRYSIVDKSIDSQQRHPLSKTKHSPKRPDNISQEYAGNSKVVLQDNRDKKRKILKLTILAFVILSVLETAVQRWVNIGSINNKTNNSGSNVLKILANNLRTTNNPQHQNSINKGANTYVMSDAIKQEYEQWHKKVRHLSQMDLAPRDWTPTNVIQSWKYHSTERKDRFPGVEERVGGIVFVPFPPFPFLNLKSGFLVLKVAQTQFDNYFFREKVNKLSFC